MLKRVGERGGGVLPSLTSRAGHNRMSIPARAARDAGRVHERPGFGPGQRYGVGEDAG